MASTCINNNLGLFPDWVNPRSNNSSPTKPSKNLIEVSEGDFEFRLEDPVKMLAADELFFNGLIMPSHVSTARAQSDEDIIRLEPKMPTVSCMDNAYLFSPKAPRCYSGWRELLGLKKLQQNSTKTTSKPASEKNLSSLGQPLLTRNDLGSVSRDQRRVSIDSRKLCPEAPRNHQLPRVRSVQKPQDYNLDYKPRSILGVPADSPRMNSSGKVVFQTLGRSSSSPSTFNGGPRVTYKGMERRSYSANVNVSPVLNVPICSMRGSSKFGLGQIFPSPHKKAGGGAGNSSTDSSERIRSHHHFLNTFILLLSHPPACDTCQKMLHHVLYPSCY